MEAAVLMDPQELLEAFEAFITTLGLDPKDVPKTLGVYKTCGCNSAITAADIAAALMVRCD